MFFDMSLWSIGWRIPSVIWQSFGAETGLPYQFRRRNSGRVMYLMFFEMTFSGIPSKKWRIPCSLRCLILFFEMSDYVF